MSHPTRPMVNTKNILSNEDRVSIVATVQCANPARAAAPPIRGMDQSSRHYTSRGKISNSKEFRIFPTPYVPVTPCRPSSRRRMARFRPRGRLKVAAAKPSGRALDNSDQPKQARAFRTAVGALMEKLLELSMSNHHVEARWPMPSPYSETGFAVLASPSAFAGALGAVRA